MRAQRWAYPLMIVATTLLLGGCGNGSPDDTGDGNGNGGDDREAPGRPVDPDPGREAPRSPLDIPHFSNVGQDIDWFLEYFEGVLAEQCGGELCVTLRVERSYQGAGDPEACGFETTDPPPGSRVEPGSVIVVKALCGSEPAPPTSTP